MKLRTLIADDEPLACERLATLLGRDPDVEIAAQCANGEIAAQALRAGGVDLAFLDIRMPLLDGFQVLEAVGKQRPPAVIFLTAYDQHAVRAFETRALDYLLKPVAWERLRAALAHVREQLAARRPAEEVRALMEERERARRIAVPNSGRVTFVEVDRIDWIESASNYALLHIGGETHILRETMTSLAARLLPADFLRVSRCAIVNLRRVRELKNDGNGAHVAILASGATIPVTRGWRVVANRLA